MIVFEIKRNGNLIKTIGSESEASSFGVFVNSFKRHKDDKDRFRLIANGANIPLNESYDWLAESISIGDEITIKIMEGTSFDQPFNISKVNTDEFVLQSKLIKFQNLKKELEEEGLI